MPRCAVRWSCARPAWRVAAPDPRRLGCHCRRRRALRVSRIHGDYHLGQLLVTDDGFAVIDFEGEPARPLAERRRPASPLRDVAGMLRSLDYAARTARARAAGFEPRRGSPLRGRRSSTATAEPADGVAAAAFELEKACYEVRYEANFRPDWTWLPLEAIERMVA